MPTMPAPQIELRDLEPMTTIAVRRETTQEGLFEVFYAEMPRMRGAVQDVGAEMVGRPFARYHHYGSDFVDLEIGAPIAAAPAGLQPISGRPDGVIGTSTLPSGRVAVTTHRGPYDGLPATYDALAAWIAAEGHTAVAGPWEVYLSDPRDTDAADLLTEVVWPLAADGG